ncbi:MAG: hypothetical protein K6E20_04940 [Acholeplasmatales bacterium]|nr:hypothetical protein [Acholeplasmatales bacterium]
MKKISKFLSLIALAFVMLLSFASCDSSGFYKDYHDAGADIEKENCFNVISVSDAKKMISNKESFIVFLGTYTKSKCVNTVEVIQEEAENIDYEGEVLYIELTSILKSNTKINDARTSLGTNSTPISEKTFTEFQNTIVLMYDEGKLKMDSQDYKYDAITKQFEVNDVISYRAVVDYISESEVYSRTK